MNQRKPNPFDPQSLYLPIPVREIYRNIRDHAELTEKFKIEWLDAIVSIFKEEILFSEKSLESKKTDAKTLLSEAMKFRTQKDYEHYDTDTENERILAEFEKWLKSDYTRRHI